MRDFRPLRRGRRPRVLLTQPLRHHGGRRRAAELTIGVNLNFTDGFAGSRFGHQRHPPQAQPLVPLRQPQGKPAAILSGHPFAQPGLSQPSHVVRQYFFANHGAIVAGSRQSSQGAAVTAPLRYNRLMTVRIVIAPQAFKQSISARAAAIAIQSGVMRAIPDAETVLIPVADGGDGTLAALIDTTGGQYFTADVTGPLGDTVSAQWGVMGDGATAVIEMALASGLALIPDHRRDPRTATTYGTGQLMAVALDAGYTRIIVGLGGSATNDGGTGMASALGVRFLNADGDILPSGGAALATLHDIDVSGLHPGLANATIIGATDVTNPLCGDTGASAIFGPQKGATPDMVRELGRLPGQSRQSGPIRAWRWRVGHPRLRGGRRVGRGPDSLCQLRTPFRH